MLKHFVKVNGNKIHVVEAIPSGPTELPTVVLIPGLGGTALGWCAVQRLLSPAIRSFTYDRLGLGHSDRTNKPRPASVLATELMDTLIASKAPAPYLLVASSYAGIICREFLEQYDKAVAGLVYVDANQENTQRERRWPFDVSARMIKDPFSVNDGTGLAQAHKCTSEEWEAITAEQAAAKVERMEGTNPAEGEWRLYESSLISLGQHRQLERQALRDRPFSVIMANLTRDFARMFAAGKKAGLGTAEDHAVFEDFLARLPATELQLNYEVLKLSSIHRMVVTSIAGHIISLWEPALCVQEIMWCMDIIEEQRSACANGATQEFESS